MVVKVVGGAKVELAATASMVMKRMALTRYLIPNVDKQVDMHHHQIERVWRFCSSSMQKTWTCRGCAALKMAGTASVAISQTIKVDPIRVQQTSPATKTESRSFWIRKTFRASTTTSSL